MLTEIEKIQRHAKRIANGKDPKVRPGMPFRFTEACTVNDCCWQGDLGIVIAGDADSHPPAGYLMVVSRTELDRQLVPGNTQGAKHCLDSLNGVTLYRPQQWTEESLEGPFLQFTEERTILHPTHGPVTIPAGFSVQCHYQREWDRELAKERRARD